MVNEENERKLLRAKERIEEQKIFKIKNEYKEQKLNELHNFKILIKEANHWHQSKILDDYLVAVYSRAIANGTFSGDFESWYNWAKNKSDWYNPLIKKEDNLLNGFDRQDI
jgi:hypothetical protein